MTRGHQAQQLSRSFLVRCWSEPREEDGQPEVMRVYVRDLSSGEEHYISDPMGLGELLTRCGVAPREAAQGPPQAAPSKAG